MPGYVHAYDRPTAVMAMHGRYLPRLLSLLGLLEFGDAQYNASEVGVNQYNASEVGVNKQIEGLHCFPESERAQNRSSFFDFQSLLYGRGRPPPLKLEIRGWDSHVLMTRMTEILLREKLGFEVDVLRFSSGAYIYDRIRTNLVDVNMEAWPGNHEYSPPEGSGSKPLALQDDKGVCAALCARTVVEPLIRCLRP